MRGHPCTDKMAGNAKGKNGVFRSLSDAVADPRIFLSLNKENRGKRSRPQSFPVKDFLQSLASNELLCLWELLLELCSVTMDRIVTEESDDEEEGGCKLSAVEDMDMTEIIQTLDGIVHWVHGYVTSEDDPVISDHLLQLAQLLHNFMLIFSGESAKLTESISRLCETWWVKGLRMKEMMVTNMILYVLAKTHYDNAKVVDVKRLWSVRSCLLLLDFEDDSADSIKELLLKTTFSPLFLKSQEGVKFISYLFGLSLSFIDSVHSVIKSQLPGAPKWVVTVYGKVYLRAWRLSSGPYLDHIETHCLQDLMYLCVHAPRGGGGGGGGGGFFTLRNLLDQFHQEITIKPVQEMLHRLYKPFLWRSMRVASADVRANAVTLMLDAFPLYDPNYTKPEMDIELQRQFEFMKELLMDQSVMVRCSCINGVCCILSYYWEMIPAHVIRDISRTLINELAFDAASSDIRVAVLQGMGVVLDQRLSHPFFKESLPVLGGHLHDRVEKVRIAFLDLLILIKGMRSIKFWTICSIDDLLSCIETGSVSLVKRIVSLLINTFNPNSVSVVDSLKRCIVLIQSNPLSARRFYVEALNYMTLKDIERFIISLLHCITKDIERDTLSNSNKRIATNQRDNVTNNNNHVRTKGASTGDIGLSNETERSDETDATRGEQCDNSDDGDRCDDGEDEDGISCDKEVFIGLLEVVVILWEGLQWKGKDDGKHVKLVSETKKVFPKLVEYFKDSRGQQAVYLIGSLLPKSVVRTLATSALHDVLASSETSEDSVALLVALVRWEQAEPVVELVRRGLETGLCKDGGKENVLDGGGGKERRRGRRRRRKGKDVLNDCDGVVPSHTLAIRILNHLMTHPVLYNKVKDLSSFWELIPLLRTVFESIDQCLTTGATGAPPSNPEVAEGFLADSVSAYTCLTGHYMIENEAENKEEFKRQLEGILIWFEEKIVSFLSPSSSDKWYQIMKRKKPRKRRRESQSEEEETISSSHVHLVCTLTEVLLSVLSDMLMCGLITDPIDTSIAQWAIKIIKSGGLISFGQPLSSLLYQLVEVGSYCEMDGIISPSSLLPSSLLLEAVLLELRLVADTQPEAFKKLWSCFKPVLTRVTTTSINHHLLAVVPISSLPVFTAIAGATLAAQVEQLRQNSSLVLPTNINELPHYVSLLVGSACKTITSGRLFVSHMTFSVEGAEAMASPQHLLSALYIGSSLTSKSALTEELLRLAQTCLTATQTGPTSHDTSITGNTGSAVPGCVTESEYPDMIKNIQELSLSIQLRLSDQ